MPESESISVKTIHLGMVGTRRGRRVLAASLLRTRATAPNPADRPMHPVLKRAVDGPGGGTCRHPDWTRSPGSSGRSRH